VTVIPANRVRNNVVTGRVTGEERAKLVANSGVGTVRDIGPNDEPGYEWFDRVTFWKRGTSNDHSEDDVLTAPRAVTIPHDRSISQGSGFDYDVPPPRHPAANRVPNEPRGKPALTVDVGKASSPSIQPRIILENPDHRRLPVNEPTPPNVPRAARGIPEGVPGRDGSHLTVPSSSKPRSAPKATPPAWVAAMKDKELPPRVRADSSDREIERRARGERSNSGSNEPRKPPGLAYPKPAATASPRDRYPREDRGDRSLGRNASIPPRSERKQTDPRRQQERNKMLSRATSLDAVDPFATPLQTTKQLPPPLEPMKLQAPAMQSNNPFSTPFDDSHAVSARKSTSEVQQNYTASNFSMPSRK